MIQNDRSILRCHKASLESVYLACSKASDYRYIINSTIMRFIEYRMPFIVLLKAKTTHSVKLISSFVFSHARNHSITLQDTILADASCHYKEDVSPVPNSQYVPLHNIRLKTDWSNNIFRYESCH